MVELGAKIERIRGEAWTSWKLANRRRHFAARLARLVRTAFRAPALFLTVLGLLASIAGLLTSILSLIGLGVSIEVVVLGLSAATLLSFFLSGELAQHLLPPDELGRLLVQGRPVSEILQSIAWRIRSVCRRFSAAQASPGVLSELQEASCDPGRAAALPSLLEQVRATMRVVGDMRGKQDQDLRRIVALKHEAGHELGISVRRLCDHVFQFSPTFFRQGVDKYLLNLREMISLAEASVSRPLANADCERFAGLVLQNRRLEEACAFRARVQEFLLRYDDLHDDVAALASSRSTSGSLQAYARALARLARTDRIRFEDAGRTAARGERPPVSEEVLYLDTLDRFFFLHRRQRAHPGFDLHSLLRSAVDRFPEESPYDPERVRLQSAVLRWMETVTEEEFEPPPSDRRSLDLRRRRFVDRLAALAEIERYFNLSVGIARSRMVRRFRQILASWRHGCGSESRVYVVASGYSKTVRELLKRGIPEPSDESSIEIFLLLSGVAGELGAREMAWELRSIVKNTKDETDGERSPRVAAGSEESLASVVRPGDRVLLLLGAECIDADGRVAHPHIALPRLGPLIRDLGSLRVATLTVVAAEDYKRLPVPFAATRFLKEHFEPVPVYEPELIDLFLSESSPDHAAWERVIRSRLRPPMARSVEGPRAGPSTFLGRLSRALFGTP